MSKVKKGWITFISLFAALFLVFGFVISLPRVSAYANTYSPSNVFSAGTGGTVGASTKGTEEGAKAYVQFTFADGGNVYFRRDLALKWYQGQGKVQYFSMQFAFVDVNFEKFTITFESAEENISKDGKTTNKIVFEPVVEKTPDEPAATDAEENTDGKTEEKKPQLLNVYINPEEKEDDETQAAELDEIVTVDASKDILITFDEGDDKLETEEDNCEIGEFNVRVKNVEPKKEENKDDDQTGDNGNEAASAALEDADEPGMLAGKFTNIGGYFLDYRSASSSTPNTPITFTADFPAGSKEELRQSVLMKSLNLQSMQLDSSDRVADTTPAVLVLNEKVYAFKLGQKFSLSYEAIDVLDDNVTVTREYYMLKTEKTEDNGVINYMPNEKELKDSDKEDGVKYSQYNYKSLTTYTYFLPSQNHESNEAPEEYVSIRFKLDDDTDENDTYVDLSWYAADNAWKDFTCNGYKEEKKKDEEGKETSETEIVDVKDVTFRFIKVNRNSNGPYYNYLKADEATQKNVVSDESKFEAAKSDYQTALDKAASYEESKTSAGSGAYIYLPSLRGLIQSDNAGYRNLKFSIYYYKPGSSTASAQTSLNYNALKLEVDKEGDYRFRVIAQDAASNAMKYYLDGELVTVTNSNVWDIKEIPEFTFHIDYEGPTIEKTEEQSLGYRNDTYNFSDFDIVALSGYQKNYTLYRYSEVNIPDGVSAPSSYADFVKNVDSYFKAFQALDEKQEDKTFKILYEISEFQSDISADDEAKWNRTDNDYHWDPDSSLSFVPQLSGYYILKVLVEDGNYPGETAEAYMVIDVRNPIDTIPGKLQWLQENVVSVILFAISGVLAIVVVVLFLIKPSDKKVEEVDLEKLKGKKKKTNKK